MKRAGIDIGGTKINIGILDEENRLMIHEKIKVSEITDLGGAIRGILEKQCAALAIPYSEIGSCGVGVPGTVSPDGKRLIKAPNIAILNENTGVLLEQTLGIPVRMVQDSRAAALGEYLCGGGKGAFCAVCITLGTGIGTGIIIDGKIFNGGLNSAGEMGHIPVEKNGRPCGCGKIGCMEKYCAGGGLDITAAELLGTGKTATDLFEAASSGNKAAADAIAEATVLLGKAIVSIINLLSPDCILFSGGLSARDEYLNPVISYALDHCYSSGTLPVLKKAELGEDAPLIGAALVGANL